MITIALEDIVCLLTRFNLHLSHVRCKLNYVGKDWNQKAERFNVSFWAVGEHTQVELFSYMVPIAHYDQLMKQRIRERTKELESTLQKIGYTVVPKLGLSYYSLTTNKPKMRKLPN